MRRIVNCRDIFALLAVLALGPAVMAQSAPDNRSGTPPVPPPTPVESAFPACSLDTHVSEGGPAQSRFYGNVEYLLWWVSGDSRPPLVTTSPPGTSISQAGVIGNPGTLVVVGSPTVDNFRTGWNDGRSGFRITLGGWIDDDHAYGVEGSFFMLDSKAARFPLGSNGSPILARPFIDATTGKEAAERIAFPGDVTGSVLVTDANTGLIGGDLLFRGNLCCGCGWRLDALGGWRTLRLVDRLTISEQLTSVNPSSPNFIVPGTTVDVGDAFGTKNEFNGLDLGLNAEFQSEDFQNLYLELFARIAFGPNHQAVDINGGTQVTVPGGAPSASEGGLLALSSNIGHHSRDDFSVVPELGIKVNYQVAPRVRLTLGYAYLYWSDVVRPGDQIDRTVNPGLLPGSSTPSSTPARPSFTFQTTAFRAQGFDAGLEFRF
jgi:hypothetical protein